MDIRAGVRGRIINSSQREHWVRVDDDAGNTGGFLVFEWWEGSDGPNANYAFDSWAETRADLKRFFQGAGWQVMWNEGR
jgi:hypothetical protein